MDGNITLQRLNPRDYGKAISFAINGMHFERYTQNKLALRLYGRYFLYLELKRATQVIAAYMQNKLVGILMADMKGEPKLGISFFKKQYIKLTDMVMSFVFKGGPDVYDTANKAMFKEYTKVAAPDGEICFLAADPAIQGRGIGTWLLAELESREKGKQIYLYTDDNCSYQFYEHRGFERVTEREIEMVISGKAVPLTCFIYSKRL
jgi:GNAT superfamily N-acetyltransferase